jgi:hypothetical protein
MPSHGLPHAGHAYRFAWLAAGAWAGVQSTSAAPNLHANAIATTARARRFTRTSAR